MSLRLVYLLSVFLKFPIRVKVYRGQEDDCLCRHLLDATHPVLDV